MVRFYDFGFMSIDLKRYLTDQNYRRQIAQEEQQERLRRAAAAAGEKPPNPGMDELQRERTREGTCLERRGLSP